MWKYCKNVIDIIFIKRKKKEGKNLKHKLLRSAELALSTTNKTSWLPKKKKKKKHRESVTRTRKSYKKKTKKQDGFIANTNDILDYSIFITHPKKKKMK